MPNVTLTHTYPKNELNRGAILKKAWSYIHQGASKRDAFKKAWLEATKLTISFWTSAKPEDIQWTIKSCQTNGIVKTELLRKWDADMIQHPLDWVSYHLRRNGFNIGEIFNTNVYSVSYEIPKLLF